MENSDSCSPVNGDNPSKKQPEICDTGQENVNLFSPGFRSVAAMAGWDEDSLLSALTVEDTPDRQCKHKKRRNSQNFRSPPASSRRKRRVQKIRPVLSMPITVLDLDSEDVNAKQEGEKTNLETKEPVLVENKGGDGEESTKSSAVSGSSPPFPCIDRLREELSCAICLDICYEPSTTPCGHSFCKKCLRSAADKCGKKCPKCRQLISNGRYCTVNIVLWNTIQLLFPKDVEARKSASASTSDGHEPPQRKSPARARRHSTRSRVVEALYSGPESESTMRQERRNHNVRSRSTRPSGFLQARTSRESLPSQDEDAALALRLQREEFMVTFAPPQGRQHRSHSSEVARANLRAMASRAVNIRIRDRRD